MRSANSQQCIGCQMRLVDTYPRNHQIRARRVASLENTSLASTLQTTIWFIVAAQ